MVTQLNRHVRYTAVFALFIFLLLPHSTYADMTSPVAQQQAELAAQLQQVENQIAQFESQLKQIGAQKNTLNRKIKQLTLQQEKLKLQIQQTNLKIQSTENQLGETQNSIDANAQKITVLKTELSGIIQDMYIHEQVSLLEVVLGVSLSRQGFLSDYLTALNNYASIGHDVVSVLNQIKLGTASLEIQKQQLIDQQTQQQNYVALVNLQKAELGQTISDQNTILKQTKGTEANYQKNLNDSKQLAAQIRSRIYSLLGVSKQITFGQALQIAEWASGVTGVRPAFLLAILTQESNLGRNVGTCNRPGDPPSKSWKVVMKPDRDQKPFLTITSDLGVNPDVTPVSCPMRDSKGNQIGWGGAMGPAQFIPSTWLGYRGQVAAVTGKAANPWDIRDAFLAAAIKLKNDGGATVGGEWSAAMRYFSGSTDTRFRFYGDNVVATAEQYQNDINNLNT